MERRTLRGMCEACGGTGFAETINPTWLAMRRRDAGLTLAAVGKRLGLTRSYLCQIEHGARPCPERVAQVYAALGDGTDQR